MAQANNISVQVTYPTLHRSPFSTPPCTSTLITPPQTFSSNENRKGIVGYYDIDELYEEMRVFGISDETRTALLREQDTTVRKSLRTAKSTRKCSLARDSQYTNRNPRSIPRNDSQTLQTRHSTAARSCYVDFSGSFHDAVRARSVKMATKTPAPIIHPNLSQWTTPTIPQTPKRKKPKSRTNQVSASEPVHIKDGLLVIANGEVVDFRKDVKRSENLEENERTRLRKEMRKHLDIVQSFDDMFEKLEATKMQIEQMKTI